MNERQVEYILREFPDRWNALQEMRGQIIDAGGSGEAYHRGMAGKGGHGDSTFFKASRLVALDEEETCLKVVREWLSAEMRAEDRAFLICLWRGSTPAEIDRRTGQIGGAAQRLKRMTRSLIQFVGRAFGGHGLACAASQRKFRPD